MIVALAANAALGFGRSHVRSFSDAVVALACALALYVSVNPVDEACFAIGQG